MRVYDDITPALQAVLRNYDRGYTRWLALHIKREKLPALDEKWAEQYGTRLAPYQRQDKKQKGLPTAVAIAFPILQSPETMEVLLMATEFASTILVGPFSREKWLQRWPEASKFVMIREQRPRGDSALTWRLQEKDLGIMANHLTTLIKSDPKSVGAVAHHIVAMHPMYGGVRRQVRTMLNSSRKLWHACHKEQSWPGPDPEHLPMMIGFRAPAKTIAPEKAFPRVSIKDTQKL
jgi:hypothetical protein